MGVELAEEAVERPLDDPVLWDDWPGLLPDERGAPLEPDLPDELSVFRELWDPLEPDEPGLWLARLDDARLCPELPREESPTELPEDFPLNAEDVPEDTALLTEALGVELRLW